MIVWWNNQLMPEEDVRISPMDHGFLVGDGVFETLVAVGGKPFAVHRHWLRLKNSADLLGISCPAEDEFRQALHAVLGASGLADARLRATVTSGPGPAGSDRGNHPPSFCVTATGLPSWPSSVRIARSPWPRLAAGALAGIKSTSYADNVRALAFAKAQGCAECLYLNERDEICEGTGSNLFLVTASGGVLTPPLESGCLAGVTRALVIELAEKLGIPLSQDPLPASTLQRADLTEAFITSTTRHVQAVAAIGDLTLPLAPGPVTGRLQAAFHDLLTTQADP
jgi:branched-chain amino acid aminotransferase